MITLLSTWTFGVSLGFVALGVFVSFKLFSFPDITTDGSFTLGAVVATVLLVAGVDPVLATLAGMAAGAATAWAARASGGNTTPRPIPTALKGNLPLVAMRATSKITARIAPASMAHAALTGSTPHNLVM